MRLVLERIKKLHPDFRPDPSWQRCGMTPSGHQLFTSTEKRSRAIPDYDPETGERRKMLHPTTAQPLYPLNKAEHYTMVRTFYLHSEGNGNIIKVDWSEPTEEEIAAALREEKIEDMVPNLAGSLVDLDMSPEDFTKALAMIARAMKGEDPMAGEQPTPAAPTPATAREVVPPPQREGGPAVSDDGKLTESHPAVATPAGEPPPADQHQPDPEVKYPRWRGAAGWELSDGTFLKGTGKKEEAIAREANLTSY